MRFLLRLLRFFLTATLCVVVLFCGALLWLDNQVRSEFSGRKWDLPSHIYARPLELYSGAAISQQQLVWELERLGYRESTNPSRPGRFQQDDQSVYFFTRGFDFADGEEPSRMLRVEFDGAQILRMETAAGESTSLARLEPLRIGGIYAQSLEDRLPLPLEQVPPQLVAGLVQVEDRGFFEHPGVSLRGISRAALANFKAAAVVEGGSTLTQQLVKNFYLNSERTLSRKIQEVLMALLLELHFSKEEILETYLNEVYLGQSGDRSVHGFGMASWHYYRQPLEELQPHQIALLVGMLKGPSQYDPWQRPQNALDRRNLVLQLMNQAGMISAAELSRSIEQPLDLATRPERSLNPYPAYFSLVRQQLERDFSAGRVEREGLQIYTALDPWLQYQLEQSAGNTLQSIEQDRGLQAGSLETGAIVTRIGSGEVVAVLGGRDPRFDGYNRALAASRPVGSLVKPFVYLTALQNPDSWRLSSQIEDAPFILPGPDGENWVPQNYDGRAEGLMPLYLALAKSQNLATSRLGLQLGVETVFDTIRILGVDPDWAPWPSYLLGAGGLTPYEVSVLYHSLAADGFYSPLNSLVALYDSEGELQGRPLRLLEQRIDSRYVHLVQYGLQVVMQQGTGRSVTARLPADMRIAGKTGTTNDQRDSWFAGFDGEHLGVIWVGRDDNQPTPLTGASGAMRIWEGLFLEKGIRSIPFVRPPGVVYEWASTEADQLTEPGCENSAYLPFVEGSEPLMRVDCRGEVVQDSWFMRLFGL